MSNPYETGILLAGNTGYNKNGKPLWPKARQQKEYTQQSAAADTQATLGNISFAIYPFFPFSYDWAMAERTGGQGTVFRPTVTFDATDTDVEYFTADVSFKYTVYTLTDLENNPLHKC